ncbi:MAG: NarK/NasA family nitrate transporter [Bacteroidetes bacterium]|nr:NarK/NasA family nitrate transporter [Bacteroidota bacterium]
MSSFLSCWEPEDEQFWEETGSAIAWKTLWITTASLVLSFATWFVMSAVVVRLPGIGFQFSTQQLFWLAAMPGLAGGSLRIIHTFLIPLYGSRLVITVTILLKLIPVIGLAFAVMDPATPFWMFMLLAFAFGFGGGDFSSYMPSTSLFFPKKKQGTALAIQAGIGNFGVSLTQFVTPWIITMPLFGVLAGAPQVFSKGTMTKEIWLQNALLWYLPLLLLFGIAAWMMIRSVPIRASFKEQLDIFSDKHTWLMTSLYLMTFGSFSGFSAAFPLMIREIFGGLENAPDPLTYAFLGPLIGSAIRVMMGPLTDRFGGAVWTFISGIGLLICSLGVTLYTQPASASDFTPFLWLMLGIFFFSGVGNASTFRQIPMIFPPRQAGGVIGWTAAVAAYGPFIFSMLIGFVITSYGGPNLFFYGASLFYLVNILINWNYYLRRGAEKPC